MTRTIQIILCAVGVLFIAAIVSPFFGRVRESDGPIRTCLPYMKQIGLAFIQYSQDYDEKLPPVQVSGGWTNAIFPYVKNTWVYECPIEGNTPAASTNTFQLITSTDFYFNSQLSGHSTNYSGDITRLIMMAEGNDGRDAPDASYNKPSLPPAWRSDKSSPAFRHTEKANYLFADGRVKFIAVGEISEPWNAKGAYFQTPKQK